jgi:hypothetical protein
VGGWFFGGESAEGGLASGDDIEECTAKDTKVDIGCGDTGSRVTRWVFARSFVLLLAADS